MSNRVYTYTRLDALKYAPYFKEIATVPQLTMSIEVARDMAYDMRIFKGNIMSFLEFSSRLFPEWNSSSQKFRYAAFLNRFIRGRIEAASDKLERDWLFGCKKNLYAAVNNIIRLEEAGANPEDIREDDRDLSLFVEMWKCLRENDDAINRFRARCEALKNTKLFDEEVAKIFKFHGRKSIVWNGFQFLTPMQLFVYRCFIEAGYEVYALIKDDTRYPYANEIWNHLYTEKNGFPAKKDWIRQGNATERNALGEILETGEETKAPNVKIIKYSNTVEFIEDIPRIKREDYYLYCTEDQTANNMLRDYFPERYETRNLLSYPIGQFLYALHAMWDENLQCIALHPDGLRKCFASGWLSVKGRNSIHYTEDLECLLPYFDGCRTIEEWSQRLRRLAEAYEKAVDVFAVSPEADAPADAKKELLGDPFHHFGVFSIKKNRMGVVFAIIGRLINMARALFGKNEPVSIQQHMSKLDAMLAGDDGMSPELFLREREIVKKIFAALESDRIKDFLCYPGDLAAALLSFMEDKFDEEEQQNRGLRTLVFNLFQVDAAPISAKGKVHICMADISRLPGAAGKYSWPIDEELLEAVKSANADTYVDRWIENNRLTALSNRYYVYSAMQNRDVEISWIEKQGEKLFAPSPYITLLHTLSNSKITNSGARKLDLEYVAGIYAHRRLAKNYHIKENPALHLYDEELAYSLCPMRYVYGYVLMENPAYRNEYQQHRAIVRLIQVMGKLLGDQYSLEYIAGQIFELFPGIRKAERRQMLDDAARWPLPENEGTYTLYDGMNYTDYRLNLKFLDENSYVRAKRTASMLMSREGRKGIFHDRGRDGGRNCEFCPHSPYCMKALFGIDYKGDQEW